jgi:hypothetical protein
MAEFQWWLLLVGLVAGGALVAVLQMDSSRREVDIGSQEREAEAGLLTEQLVDEGHRVDIATVAAVLRAHADYLRLPPPDRLEVVDDLEVRRGQDTLSPTQTSAGGNADRAADEIGHDRGSHPDPDLPPA